MRLPDFILANIEPILKNWESFADSVWPSPSPVASRMQLRDHAEEMLRAVAEDMKAPQTDVQQSHKSKGLGQGGQSLQGMSSDNVDGASNRHALGRLSSGFELPELVAEYRALRASVIRLWLLSMPGADVREMPDIIRFNEGIDQLLAESVASYVRSVDSSRECFLGILGHDLRNPLAAATMHAYLLTESTSLDPQSRRMATTLCASLEAMNFLIRDLLDFTSIRLGARMVVTPQAMDLLPLCREVIDEMQVIHPTRDFQFNFDDRGDLTCEWDAQRIRQAISNLLGNAVQHGNSTSPITLTATLTGINISLSVRNSGRPIPEAMLGVIFEPMKQNLPTASSSAAGSVGLGLYIAREVATAHGGSIKVASSDDETVFTLVLPRFCQAT